MARRSLRTKARSHMLRTLSGKCSPWRTSFLAILALKWFVATMVVIKFKNAPLIEESELTTLKNLASKGSGPFSEEVERVFQMLRYRVGLDEL